ncbi:MAG: HNH endonuclease domain-containing protein [Candidatus Nanopelagicales bacterium]
MSMTARPPGPEFQLEFIEKFQRLLESGSFVATYKYALLVALCNVAAEHGFDDDREQRIPVQFLGQQFLHLYWTHVRAYPGLNHPLRQNTGRQAAILATVSEARSLSGNPDRVDAPGSVPERLVWEATERVRRMPLMKLQTIGEVKKAPDHPDNFLYATILDRHCITLRAGVSACLRRFRRLIISSTQAAWSEYVRRNNPELGVGHDLDDFLFGVDRSAVHPLVPHLLDLQRGRCFYSGSPLEDSDVHVDHFIPWAKYPFNSPFNLVATSRTANLRKRDHLAALPHLQKWRVRNSTKSPALLDMGAIEDDRDRAISIARYAYSSAARLGVLGWVSGSTLDALTGWEAVVVAS